MLSSASVGRGRAKQDGNEQAESCITLHASARFTQRHSARHIDVCADQAGSFVSALTTIIVFVRNHHNFPSSFRSHPNI
jgi:hypothetical protein